MNTSQSRKCAGLGDYFGVPPVLIAASSDSARSRAVATAEACGLRAVTVAIEAAEERLDIQSAASAIWLEVDDDMGDPLDRLLQRIDLEADVNQLPAIVCATSAIIDPVAARITHPSVELLFDATQSERAAALALVMAKKQMGQRLHDVSRESSDARLRQLSDEVGRIAATLARLSVGPGMAAIEKPTPPKGDIPHVSLETVRQVIRARRLRSRYFDEELFADPAWDMLLDLLQAEIAQLRVPVSSLCIAAAVPATTALRWIKTMTDAGLFKRRSDPHDGRRVFVELAPKASAAMRQYFNELGGALAA